MNLRASLGTALILCLLIPIKASANNQLTIQLQPNKHALLIRHAIAPGTGDPADFQLNHCGTQRNLSADGIAQAKRIGERLRGLSDRLPDTLAIFTSQWCRCRDTAAEFDITPVVDQPLLNSFFRDGDVNGQQNAALKEWLASQPFQAIPVLVTHQVNITALTGVYPRSGEIIVVEINDSGINVINRIVTE